MNVSTINYMAVAAAAIAFWALGALWYSPVLFSKQWMKELGFTGDPAKKPNMVLIFGLSFLLMFFMVLGIAFILSGYAPEKVTWVSGLCLGTLSAVCFTMTAIGINYLYQMRSLTLWLIDAVYMFLGLGIAGIILGAWR